jgi:D,D-heptose 1,7-bisphosphate phosphatase
MKKRAIFLDRDGVLATEKGYVTRLEDLEIFSYTYWCIEQIHRLGYLAIVVTNQSAVARGILGLSELERMNQYMKREVGVDDVFFCPHDGTEKEPCGCRKPRPGMIERAISMYEIERSSSFLVGDRESDIQTGIAAGLKTVLLQSGYPTEEAQIKMADYYCRDLETFVRDIVTVHSHLYLCSQ